MWSEHLRKTLNNGNYEGFCHHKSELALNNDLQLVWKFLKTMFQTNSKKTQLEILGYSTEKINNIVSQFYNNSNGIEKNSDNDKVIKNIYNFPNILIWIFISYVQVKNEDIRSNLLNPQEEQTIVSKFDNFNLQYSKDIGTVIFLIKYLFHYRLIYLLFLFGSRLWSKY